jgi:hypothetical protein
MLVITILGFDVVMFDCRESGGGKKRRLFLVDFSFVCRGKVSLSKLISVFY